VIVSALNVVAPEKEINVKKGANLNLARDTLEWMKMRNAASGRKYRNFRNEVTHLIRRDKHASNLLSLNKAHNDPKVLWGLADQALGKDRLSLPATVNSTDGTPTMTALEAAEAVNKFFVDKVDALRGGSTHPANRRTLRPSGCTPRPWGGAQRPAGGAQRPGEANNDLQETPNVPPFFFKFANAKKITKIINGLNNTEALGMDGIPTSLLKKGVEVLAGPISHMVNRSLAEGCVLAAFKIGRVHPIHKGKGKPREDRALNRPVSILSSMRKVLESHMKGNLKAHLTKVDSLPGSQYGFRTRRSCTTALAQATVLATVEKNCECGKIANFDFPTLSIFLVCIELSNVAFGPLSAPLWTIRGCSPQCNLYKKEEDPFEKEEEKQMTGRKCEYVITI
jgi:hypothetical protein